MPKSTKGKVEHLERNYGRVQHHTDPASVWKPGGAVETRDNDGTFHYAPTEKDIKFEKTPAMQKGEEPLPPPKPTPGSPSR